MGMRRVGMGRRVGTEGLRVREGMEEDGGIEEGLMDDV